MWSKSLEALWSHIDFKRCYFHHFLSWNLKLIASDHPRLYVKGVNKGTGNLWQTWPPKPRQSQDPVPHCMTHLKYNVFMNFTLISTSKHLNTKELKSNEPSLFTTHFYVFYLPPRMKCFSSYVCYKLFHAVMLLWFCLCLRPRRVWDESDAFKKKSKTKTDVWPLQHNRE